MKTENNDLTELSLEEQILIEGGFWKELAMGVAATTPMGLVVLSNLVFVAGVRDGYNAA